MVNNALAPVQNGAVSIMDEVIAKGDLSKLSGDERARYYAEVCQSMGLNPLTKPFDYINLNGKLTLYAAKTATDQLRTIRGVSVYKVEAETTSDGVRIVTAYARDSTGREDMDLGAVNVKGLQGEALANAYMKALTKAKRRVTLSICGLGWLDESEVESVPSARPVTVNVTTGEIVEPETERAEPRITDAQIRKIHAIKNELGWSDAQIKAGHGKASAKDMTATEAGNFIDWLESQKRPEPEQPIEVDPNTGEIVPPASQLFQVGPGIDPDRYTS